MSIGDCISGTMGCDDAYESMGMASDMEPKKLSLTRLLGSTMSPTTVARYCAKPGCLQKVVKLKLILVLILLKESTLKFKSLLSFRIRI